MSKEEKQLMEQTAKAFEVLPPEKKEYLIGYAEGVEAMRELLKRAEQKNAEKSA